MTVTFLREIVVRLVYHHADVDLGPILKRDGTIRPRYELTVPEGVPLDEHQRIAERSKLEAITRAPRDKSGTPIKTIDRVVPQIAFGTLERMMIAEREEAAGGSKSKKRRRTSKDGLPRLEMSPTPASVPPPAPAPTDSDGFLSSPPVSEDDGTAPKSKEVLVVKIHPQQTGNVVTKRFICRGKKRLTRAGTPLFLRFPSPNLVADMPYEKSHA